MLITSRARVDPALYYHSSGGLRARPNHSLNRTFCGMRKLGVISFSPNCRMPQNAG